MLICVWVWRCAWVVTVFTYLLTYLLAPSDKHNLRTAKDTDLISPPINIASSQDLLADLPICNQLIMAFDCNFMLFFPNANLKRQLCDSSGVIHNIYHNYYTKHQIIKNTARKICECPWICEICEHFFVNNLMLYVNLK